MSALAARQAYARWAPTYDAENAVTALECQVVERLSPGPSGLRLLDVGCGTGRRLVDTGATRAVGIEPCAQMLDAGHAAHAFGPEVELLPGDARTLPVPDTSFDLVWCRLMIGHVRECSAVYHELARVAAPGATIVVTDFHPTAYALGQRRTFRVGDEVLEVEHHLHTLDEQVAAAAVAGLRWLGTAEGIIGPSVQDFFERANKAALYAQQRGQPVVLGLAFARDG